MHGDRAEVRDAMLAALRFADLLWQCTKTATLAPGTSLPPVVFRPRGKSCAWAEPETRQAASAAAR